jgi:hypothetical protein
MCFNKDSANLSLICYFTIKLENGTNEYFLTTYYIWQKHTKELNTKREDNYNYVEEEREHEHEDKNEVVLQPKQRPLVFC